MKNRPCRVYLYKLVCRLDDGDACYTVQLVSQQQNCETSCTM